MVGINVGITIGLAGGITIGLAVGIMVGSILSGFQNMTPASKKIISNPIIINIKKGNNINNHEIIE